MGRPWFGVEFRLQMLWGEISEEFVPWARPEAIAFKIQYMGDERRSNILESVVREVNDFLQAVAAQDVGRIPRRRSEGLE
jgi:hypothetical protein